MTTIPAPAPRLLCFHHAGGGASLFRRWRSPDPGVDVVAVQTPGREERFGETRHRDIVGLVDQLDAELAPVLEHRHLLFGHSMGALVAYRLARQRVAAGRRAPEALLLAAYPAPHLPSPLPGGVHLDDIAFARVLADLGGLPAELLDRPEWLSAFLPTVRDDISLCQSHAHTGGGALPCPIVVFGGRNDPLVSERELAAWERYTESSFTLHMLDGDHFFVRDARARILDVAREAALSAARTGVGAGTSGQDTGRLIARVSS